MSSIKNQRKIISYRMGLERSVQTITISSHKSLVTICISYSCNGESPGMAFSYSMWQDDMAEDTVATLVGGIQVNTHLYLEHKLASLWYRYTFLPPFYIYVVDTLVYSFAISYSSRLTWNRYSSNNHAAQKETTSPQMRIRSENCGAH